VHCDILVRTSCRPLPAPGCCIDPASGIIAFGGHCEPVTSSRASRVRPETYQMVAERADTYWWYRARRMMSLDVLRRAGTADRCRCLDLGSGPGGNLGLFDPLNPALVVGVDISPLALGLAQQTATRASLVRANIDQRLPFADASFDVATIFNVLYHQWVSSEHAIVGEARRVLRRGGLLLVTEPAFPALAREMDAAAMGRKRYRLAEITGICRRSGLDVLLGSYFTSFGFPILLALKALHWAAGRKDESQRKPAVDMKSLPPLANAILYRIATLEGRLIAGGLRVPCGTTLVCLARKT
jgi:SAM-dependent methyltransferase